MKDQKSSEQYVSNLLKKHTINELKMRLGPKNHPAADAVPGGSLITATSLEKRWNLLDVTPENKEHVYSPNEITSLSSYTRNIENLIGTIKIPVGLAGPLRVNGVFAQGDYYIPLATTEAALVASFHRGALLITAAGGCTSILINEGVSRAPGFVFQNTLEASQFIHWCLTNYEVMRKHAESTTRFGKLSELKINIEGNHVYLIFEYTTGDASGQNMVTIATEAIVNYIIEECPIKPQQYYIEANLSGDKKASIQSFQNVRGKKVTAEVHIPADLVKKYLHTTPEKMAKYWNISALGGVLSGTIGVQGHYANGLAALYLATGQDVACIAEAAVGVTRMEKTASGDLYAAVTLPNLIVGTVGGGTGLPSQKACLSILGLEGAGHARAFAEVCAALALAGELSIKGAICSQEFTRAHKRLARGKEKK